MPFLLPYGLNSNLGARATQLTNAQYKEARKFTLNAVDNYVSKVQIKIQDMYLQV